MVFESKAMKLCANQFGCKFAVGCGYCKEFTSYDSLGCTTFVYMNMGSI